jgi:serine phosphatase RsbU (regulator of sigma subunit)
MVHLEPRSRPGTDASRLASAAELPSAARAPRVLVIDDDPEIHQLLRARLEARGLQVWLAASGEEGVARLSDVKPDLIFLDVAMSGMTGIDVLDHVRSQRVDVAVILTTAYSSEQVAIAALRHGADDYLRKPFDRVEFQATLDRTLARLTLSRKIALLQQQLEHKQALLTQEIARAAAVQADLLPMVEPAVAGFDIAARCLPARAVGGDFYDWQLLPSGTLSITVGDVMGKGMSAALLMATVRAVVRAMVPQHGPAAAVQHTAAALDEDLGRSGSFVTLFHAQLDVRSAELRYVDAGHGQVVLRRTDGSLRPLEPWGLPIGVLSSEQYREGSVVVAPGDLLVIYSDGLIAARPDLFQDQASFSSHLTSDLSASAITERLVELATAGGPLPDDLTVVAVRRARAS